MSPTEKEGFNIRECQKAHEHLSKELGVMWIKLDKQEDTLKEIHTIGTDVRLLSNDVKHLVSVQQEIKKEVEKQKDRLEDSSSARIEFEATVNQRIHELDATPARQALREKELVRHQIIIAIVMGTLVFLGSILGNLITGKGRGDDGGGTTQEHLPAIKKLLEDREQREKEKGTITNVSEKSL